MIPFHPHRLSVIAVGLIGTLALLANGCGRKQNGPKRFHVSGKVTFKGDPVPKGYINFRPDNSKQNSGPGSGAPIVDGKYELEDGKGVVGGPYIVEISGSDGVAYRESGEDVPDGKELFPKYTTTFRFPEEKTTKDFDVPATETRKKKPKRNRNVGCDP